MIGRGLEVPGLQALTEGKPVFINLPHTLFIQDFWSLLPRDQVVIELLETVEPDEQVLDACRRLRKQGYQLALDDFIDSPEWQVMLPFASYVKVDFIETTEQEQAEFARRLIPRGICMLAEKVETQAEVDTAKAAGYQFFQGYFFSKPVMVSGKGESGTRMNYLRLLRELDRPEMEVDEVERIISLDSSVSYRVLRAVNSVHAGVRSEVASIKQALVLLGSDQLRKWACVWVLAELGQDKPAGLIVETIRRARFCELLAAAAGIDAPSNESFMLGLFSTIDAIVGRPKEDVLAEISVSEPVKEGILGGEGTFTTLLRCAIEVERGDWTTCNETITILGVTDEQVATSHAKAAEFAAKADSD